MCKALGLVRRETQECPMEMHNLIVETDNKRITKQNLNYKVLRKWQARRWGREWWQWGGGGLFRCNLSSLTNQIENWEWPSETLRSFPTRSGEARKDPLSLFSPFSLFPGKWWGDSQASYARRPTLLGKQWIDWPLKCAHITWIQFFWSLFSST